MNGEGDKTSRLSLVLAGHNQWIINKKLRITYWKFQTSLKWLTVAILSQRLQRETGEKDQRERETSKIQEMDLWQMAQMSQRQLEIARDSQRQLEIARDSQRQLEIARDCYRQLKIARDSKRQQEIARDSQSFHIFMSFSVIFLSNFKKEILKSISL